MTSPKFYHLQSPVIATKEIKHPKLPGCLLVGTLTCGIPYFQEDHKLTIISAPSESNLQIKPVLDLSEQIIFSVDDCDKQKIQK